jgi:hypothetical protein
VVQIQIVSDFRTENHPPFTKELKTGLTFLPVTGKTRSWKWVPVKNTNWTIFSFSNTSNLDKMSTLSSATRPGAGSGAAAGTATRLAQFKLVLLGESAVGKSSLVLRFVKGQFHEFQVN